METLLQTFIQINTIFDKLFEWLKDCYWLRCCNNYYNKQEENEKFKKYIFAEVKEGRLPVLFLEPDHFPKDGYFRKDKELILKLVKEDGFYLRCTYGATRSDKEVVLAAVRQNGLALKYTYPVTRSDEEVVLAAVRQNGLALYYAYDVTRSDEEVVLAAVRQNGLALEYASDELIKDKELVFEAVRQNGLALKYASDELRKDKEVVSIAKYNILFKQSEQLEITKNTLDQSKYLKEEHIEFAKEMLTLNLNPVSMMHPDYRRDYNFIICLIHSYPKTKQSELNIALQNCFLLLSGNLFTEDLKKIHKDLLSRHPANSTTVDKWNEFVKFFESKYQLKIDHRSESEPSREIIHPQLKTENGNKAK